MLLIALYALGFVGYRVWTALRWPRPWWLHALATVAFWAFMPILVLPLLATLLGAELPVWMLTLIAAAEYARHFVWPLRPQDQPHNPGPMGDARILTANLLKHNHDAESIVRTLRAEAADLVALQELRPSHAQAIARDLADLYPYQSLHPGDDSEGMGLLSRTPLEHLRLVPAVAPDADPTLVGQVSLAGAPVWIVNMHTRIPGLRTASVGPLTLPVGLQVTDRRRDIQDLVALMQTLEGPAILIGDMNATDECLDYHLAPKTWVNAFRAAGSGAGLTYPVGAPFFGVRLPFPLFRIDHIFIRGNLRPVWAYTGAMPGSDHRYVAASLALTRE
jgi:endonuclease/exonuclease/phosphatase (EEP) superfamily protein YafD